MSRVALALVGALVLAACAPAMRSTTSQTGLSARESSGSARAKQPLGATTSFAAAGCPRPAAEVRQSMSGELSSCLRVGSLAAGTYHVVLEQVPPGQGAGVTAKGGGAATASPGPVVHVVLSPPSGAPGTTLTAVGTLASALPRQPGQANLCWDGCPDGLQYEGVPLRWTSPTTFQASLVVPGAPWIEANPDRVALLRSGSYPVGVQCLSLVRGCGLGGAEGTASFHLEVPTSPGSPCRAGPSCAHVAVSPGTALPGDVVRVTGFAPLVSVIGPDRPFAFQLQVISGAPNGPEVRFTRAGTKGIVLLHLGHGALDVQAPPSFASLGPTAPLVQVGDGLARIAADPAEPSTVAWCGAGEVTVSEPAGQAQFPTAAAASVLKGMGFGLLGSPATTCVAVAPEGGGANGGPPVLAAAFVVAPGGQAPVADVALLTADAGRSWAPLPVPPGASPASFGGFRYQEGALEALFAPKPTITGAPAASSSAPLVEVSSPGGRHWHPASLSCPAQGPCLTFGAYLPGNCAMDGTAQSVLRSGDQGRQWSEPAWPALVEACAPAELVATSASTELLVDSESAYTLRRSTDGGTTWADIGLPPLSGEQPGGGLGRGPAGITVLPGGSLLVTGQRGTLHGWELLRPGATSWCPVRGLAAGVQRSAESAKVILIGGQLWWLSQPGGAAAVAHHLDAAGLSC